jgi:HD-GYP domain-containing protein (c-di-GMP phosphodiesterase class II)
MFNQKENLFLTSSQIPHSAPISWAVIDHSFTLKYLSEAFLVSINKPLTMILNQPLSKCFSALDTTSIRLSEATPAVAHWVDDMGGGIQGIFCSYNDNGLWCLIITQLNLDEKWLMELHPNYDHVIQSSDEWLAQIEAVITSKPEDVFNTAVNQAMELTHSNIGYLHLYDDKEGIIELTAWSDSASLMFEVSETNDYKLSDAGVWADSIRTRAAVIHNDHVASQERLGLSQFNLTVKNHVSVPIVYRNRIVGVIGVGNRDKPYTLVDAKSLSIFSSIFWHSIELPKSMHVLHKQSQVIRDQREKLSQTLVQLIGAVSDAVELKDAYTAGHQKSVAQLAYLLGERLGFDEHRLEGLKLGALIHDIGKLAIPTQILSKSSKLTAEEYALVKMHSQQGTDIIDEVDFPWPIREMILQHHERLDGSGYPNGLQGEQILLEAKIISVADVADSVLSHRPYRPSLGMRKLTEILHQGKGTLFESQIVDECLDILSAHDMDNIQCVCHLSLEPLIEVELYHSLAEVRRKMADSNVQVAVVIDETKTKIVGVVDKAILGLWRSPLLDTAAERSIDRSIENKRVHQIMRHHVPSVASKTILKDAKYQLGVEQQDYLIVFDAERPVGCVTWKTFANAQCYEFDSQRHH